jgi:peptidoglycan/xylan/chitin deacetylase (PgdA/CDA1 family)
MQSHTATIVMYHYVRDPGKSRYPNIKGMTKQGFIKQLNFIDRNYTIVRMEDCLECIRGESKDFPENAALLTFDDGYLEHFTEVFPILDQRGVQGSFFPPVQSTLEGKVLDVNKIHFILASSDEPKKLLEVLKCEIKNMQSQYGLEDPEVYFNRIDSSEHPYDPLEVVTFKRVLQRELPLNARHQIISRLFSEFVGVDEDVFSNELYMNETQLKTMIRHGMFVGGHGYSHKWLDSIDETEQKFELDQTERFLDSLGVDPQNNVMCYPYGGYNSSLVQQLETSSFTAGLTTVPGSAILIKSKRFELSRIDTNEIGNK